MIHRGAVPSRGQWPGAASSPTQGGERSAICIDLLLLAFPIPKFLFDWVI
jgi:hypothetical protein